MISEKTSKIHERLRFGDTTAALDSLYLLCINENKEYLEESITLISRLKLIQSSDRSGIISFEERLRVESHICTSILQIVKLIEQGRLPDKGVAPDDVQHYLDTERKKRIDAESRVRELQKIINDNNVKTKQITVRGYIKDPKIPLSIVALTKSVTQETNYAVVLEELGGKYRLPIIIGTFEAQSMAVAIEKMVPNKPLTHDLMKNSIIEMGFTLKEIIIDTIEDGIFFSKIILANETNYIEIDSRTSDAIALAIRFDAPISSHRYILEAAGVIV